jgi:hypothetical protein
LIVTLNAARDRTLSFDACIKQGFDGLFWLPNLAFSKVQIENQITLTRVILIHIKIN